MELEAALAAVPGDAALASAFLAYAGPFPADFRAALTQKAWPSMARPVALDHLSPAPENTCCTIKVQQIREGLMASAPAPLKLSMVWSTCRQQRWAYLYHQEALKRRSTWRSLQRCMPGVCKASQRTPLLWKTRSSCRTASAGPCSLTHRQAAQRLSGTPVSLAGHAHASADFIAGLLLAC